MIRTIMCIIAILGSRQDLQILEPNDLKDAISGFMSDGSIVYSVSTFGDILYSEHTTVDVVLPAIENINGCENLSHPETLTSKKFVWLMERGVCTYSKKAFISQQSGAFAVLVYHNDENANVSNIIPCADAICEIIR